MTFMHKLSHRLAIARTGLLCALAAIAAAACNLSEPQSIDALNPPPADTTVTAVVIADPDTTQLQLSTSHQFRAYGRRGQGDSVEVRLDWTATGGTITTDGLYSSSTAGSFRIRGRARNARGATDSVVVRVLSPTPTLAAVVVTPATASLLPAGVQQFSVAGRLSDGSTGSVAVTWSASGGTVSTDGMFTAPTTAGTYRVIAAEQAGSLADTASVTVAAAPPTLTGVTVAPATVSLQRGGTRQFSVSGRLSDGSSTAVSVTWVATGGIISASGLYTAGQTPGAFRVIASAQSGGVADTSDVTITAPVLSTLSLTPATVTLPVNGTQQFSIAGTWSDGSTTAPPVSYSVTGGSISTSGQYTAPGSAGSYRVVAQHAGGTLADSSVVTVTAPTVVSCTVTPGATSVAFGQTVQFSSTGSFSNGTTGAVQVSYTATGGSITSSGLYTAGNVAGNFRVIAAVAATSISCSSSVAVTDPLGPPRALQSITVSPNAATVQTGAAQQFSASGRYSDNTTDTVSITWSASSGSITTGGRFTAGASAGTAIVRAVSLTGSFRDSATVTVTAAPPPTLTQVILTPASTSLATGGAQQFSVSGLWSNGATTAPSVTYFATGGTVTSGGLYTAGSIAGTFRVIATQQGGTLADSAAVTVTPAPPLGNVPELPNGYVLRATHTGSPLVPSGWITNSDGTSGVTVVDDPQAPASATPVMRVNYPAGMRDGSAPVGMEYPGTNGARQLFYTYWFKYNSTFQGHNSQVNKHLFVFGANGSVLVYSEMRFIGNVTQGNMDFQFQGGMAAPTYDKRLVDNYGGNQLSISKNQWHRVSLELIYGSNSTGIVRAWVDGVKVGEITNANFATGIGVVKLDPTWGGNSGDIMTQAGFLYFDEVRFYTQ